MREPAGPGALLGDARHFRLCASPCSCSWELSSLSPSQGTLPLSRFLRGGEAHLASGGWRPGMLLSSLRAQDTARPESDPQAGALPQRAGAEVLSGLGRWAAGPAPCLRDVCDCSSLPTKTEGCLRSAPCSAPPLLRQVVLYPWRSFGFGCVLCLNCIPRNAVAGARPRRDPACCLQ